MKMLVAAAAVALLTAPVLAQSSPSSQNSEANQSPQTMQNQDTNSQANAQSSKHGLMAAQKIKQDLQKEGFTDVKVVAESFVVQGKSPDGDPVVMTIGPHGMSVFEAMNAKGSNSGTVGSSNESSGSSNSNSSTNPSSGMKH
jgi:hypothetical protein